MVRPDGVFATKSSWQCNRCECSIYFNNCSGLAYSASLVDTQLRVVLSAVTLIRWSGFDVRDTDALDTDRFEVDQVGLFTEAEFKTKAELNSKILAS